MQSNQSAIIDMPLKLLAWQDSGGPVWLAYNGPDWLVQQHNINDRPAVVAKMRKALAGFAVAATGSGTAADSANRNQ